jgi:hypothetical protein
VTRARVNACVREREGVCVCAYVCVAGKAKLKVDGREFSPSTKSHDVFRMISELMTYLFLVRQLVFVVGALWASTGINWFGVVPFRNDE